MTADELRALQAPLKAQYKENPASAVKTLHATGELDLARISCTIVGGLGNPEAGLHPAVGGDGSFGCSGDMLLQSLVACAGTTLCAVATALAVPLRGGKILAEGEIDFRGTLGVSKEAPIGFTAIRLRFVLDTDAPREQIDKLVSLTERFCVILQTLKSPPSISMELVTAKT